ncbi:2576_t:CDS:2 [Rhizophagus irregularis]|nr:2576_t:CDS:2 [Rhizophagus irregularis]
MIEKESEPIKVALKRLNNISADYLNEKSETESLLSPEQRPKIIVEGHQSASTRK